MCVLGPLVPHHKVVSLVQCDGLLVEVRIALPQPLQEADRELLTALARLEPDLLEVAIVAEVLRNGNRQVQVLHSVPPLARYKDGLAGILHALDDDWEAVGALRALGSLHSWQEFVEVLDGLIIFTPLSQMLAADQLFSDSWTWWHKNPAFVPADACVPGRCSKRVLMHLTSRASWSDQEPSMRWRSILPKLSNKSQSLKVNTSE